MPTVGPLEINVTEDDITAARAVSATGSQLIARSIHSELDRLGVPRGGRNVKITVEAITIDMPPGWELAQ